VDLWVWNSSGFAINKHESLIEVWAVFKSSDVRSNVLGLSEGLLLLSVSVFWIAIVTWGGVWDGPSLSINKSESLIEIWAVLKRSDIRSNILLLSKSIVFVAVVVDLWVWNSCGFAIIKLESLIKVWAMFKGTKWCSMWHLWILFLNKSPVFVAVVVDLWVWNSCGFAILKLESLIEIWAMFKSTKWCSMWHLWVSLLNEGPVGVAVVIDLWVWDSFGLTIGKSVSLIEIWAVLKRAEWCSMRHLWITLLNHLVIFVAVETDFWVWHGFGLTIIQGEPLIKIWAVLKSVYTRSPVWITIHFGGLLQSITSIAVISNIWVWHTSGLTIGKGEPLIKVRAVLKSTEWGSMRHLWILLLNQRLFLFVKLIVWIAVEASFWPWNTFSLAIIKSESLIEVRAVL